MGLGTIYGRFGFGFMGYALGKAHDPVASVHADDGYESWFRVLGLGFRV